MQFNNLITDDDAVSPVIGVILMVAITVILAAVIASFVLGLGNEATDQTPTASFTFDYEQVEENPAPDAKNWGVVTVKHDGGNTIQSNELYLRGSGFNVSGDDKALDNEIGPSGSPKDYTWPDGSTESIQAHTDATVEMTGPGPWATNGTTSGSDGGVVSGDRVGIYAAGDYEIDIVYEAQEGQSSSTLQSDEGPDA